MSYFVPCSATFNTAIKNRESARYYKLLVDINNDNVLEDITSQIESNKIGGGLQNGGSSQWRATIKNVGGTYREGTLRGAACRIDAKCGDSEYVTIFTGFVDSRGLSRSLSYPNDDVVVINMFDYTKTIAINRKTDNLNFVNFTAFDPSSTGTSILHKLTLDMGLTAGQLDVSATIAYTKDYVGLSNDNTAWKEVGSFSDAFLGNAYFRYDGKLRMISPFTTGYVEPTSEWIFGDSASADMPVNAINSDGGDILCNRVDTEFDRFQASTSRVIHKNMLLWNALYSYNEMTVPAGQYWPGETVEGKTAALEFKDPKTGVAWDMAINIVTPTIGAYGETTAYDIECYNGLMTLHSFNGVTGTDASLTEREPQAAQIILKNNTAGTVTIRKMEIRGEPIRIISKDRVRVQDEIVDDWLLIPKSVDGKYITSADHGYQTCKWWNTYGSVPRKAYNITTNWLPQIQKGALVKLALSATAYPPSGVNDSFVIGEYAHPEPKGTMTTAFTQLTLMPYVAFNLTGTSQNEKQQIIASPAPEQQDQIESDISNRPTYTILQTGYDEGGGTTTPTQVTVLKVKGIYRAVQLTWDKQLNLTNLDHYEVQVSSDQSNWYSLRFDGVDWKDTLDDVTEWPTEMLLHSEIVLGGTADDPTDLTLYYRIRRVTNATPPVEGTWSATATGIARSVKAGDLASSSIYANNIIAAQINTMLLRATDAIVVGNSGDNDNPVEGDLRTTITDQIIKIAEQYTAGEWSTVKGIILGLFTSLIGCNGLYHTNNPITNTQFLPRTDYLIYNFENNQNNQYGIDDWTGGGNVAYDSVIYKFGSYSIKGNSTSTFANLSKSNYWTVGQSQSAATWVRYSEFPTLAMLESISLIYYHANAIKDILGIQIKYTGEITYKVQKNDTVNVISTGYFLSLDVWYFLAFSYDSNSDTFYCIINSQIYSTTGFSGTWGAANKGTFVLQLSSYTGFTGLCNADVTLSAGDLFINTDLWIQYYNSSNNWNTDYSAADIILRTDVGGRIVYDDQQPEASVGTYHAIMEEDRPSWILSAGTSASFADVDCSAYVPIGVRMLKIKFSAGASGNGTYLFRRKGSTETAQDKCGRILFTTTLGSSIDVLCDPNGVFQYQQLAGTGIYINIEGYYF